MNKRIFDLSGRIMVLLLLCLALFVTGCGGGSGSNDGIVPAPVVPTATPTVAPTGPTDPTPTPDVPDGKARIVIDMGERGTGLENAYFAYTAVGDAYIEYAEIDNGIANRHEYAQQLSFNEIGGPLVDNTLSFDVDTSNSRINIYVESDIADMNIGATEFIPYNGHNYVPMETISVAGGGLINIDLDQYKLCNLSFYFPKSSWNDQHISNGILYVVDDDHNNDRKVGNYNNQFENEWYQFSFLNDESSGEVVLATRDYTGAMVQSETTLIFGTKEFGGDYDVGSQIINATDKITFGINDNLVNEEVGVFEFSEAPGDPGYLQVDEFNYDGDRMFFLSTNFSPAVSAMHLIECLLDFGSVGETTVIIIDGFEKTSTGEIKEFRLELPIDITDLTPGKHAIAVPVPLNSESEYFLKATLKKGVKNIMIGGFTVQEIGFWELIER